ncbi:baseplate hub protein [Erwinia amylovora]|uniref:baseplate hub protein n=1 Tax=Erwinia amylovora TaxID=552 RepID=UPI001443D37E|nr:hypothetical protein [Erwinia amylovora]
MPKNWMRHFEMLLTDDNGAGIVLSDFKIKFEIEWTNTMWPRVATIKVYNLSRNTNNRILGSEFSKIRMIAGYDGIASPVNESQVGKIRNIDASKIGQTEGQNFGVIFNGDIRFTVTGRDNPTDTYILIQAIDGHRAFTNAIVNTTVAAGYTAADLHAVAMKSFNAFGVTQGITSEFPSTVFPRGRALLMSTRDLMKNISEQCNATWQIVDNQVQMVSNNKYIHEAVVLNSDTGLIGMPQQTMGAGVNVRCLINPNIRVCGLIELDQSSVYRATLSGDQIAGKQSVPGKTYETEAKGNLDVVGIGGEQPASINADGLYIVAAINYRGDTRGQEWYMDLMCLAKGGTSKLSSAALSIADPEAVAAAAK